MIKNNKKTKNFNVLIEVHIYGEIRIKLNSA